MYQLAAYPSGLRELAGHAKKNVLYSLYSDGTKRIALIKPVEDPWKVLVRNRGYLRVTERKSS